MSISTEPIVQDDFQPAAAAPTSSSKLHPELALARSKGKKIWIDLDNSPHVPFFKPIAEELERRGYSVVFTARDCFQVRELADLMKLKYRCIGRHYGKHTIAKLAGIGDSRPAAASIRLRQRPHLAVSHGSRSMFALASMLRIPTITIMDYEHARWAWFLGNAWAMLPDVIPGTALKLRKDRILRYPGIKEDVYAPSFRPDPAIRSSLGIANHELVVTLRPLRPRLTTTTRKAKPCSTAVFEVISQTADVKVVLVPRTAKQEAELRSSGLAYSSRESNCSEAGGGWS